MLLFSLQKDDMEVEHLATLERLRQSQRQDYLKVSSFFNCYKFVNVYLYIVYICFAVMFY